MAIQWFPGHMTQAKKKAEETLAHTDVVIEVVDARIPAASHNPMIEQMRLFRQRPCLKILNKADLADPNITQQWLQHFNAQENIHAVALSCKKPGDANKIPRLCAKLAPHRDSPIKPLRMMIMGIPNVGKSTLMNALLNRRIAKVGDEPAVTKSQQRFELSPLMSITDTPGMMWPKIAYESDGYLLAACHAIGRNAVIDEDVAIFLANILLQRYPQQIQQRYRTPTDSHAQTPMDGVDLLQYIAQRRAFRLRAGEWDLEKTAITLLTEFRAGTLGRISLESPSSRAEMMRQATAVNRDTETDSDTDIDTDSPTQTTAQGDD